MTFLTYLNYFLAFLLSFVEVVVLGANHFLFLNFFCLVLYLLLLGLIFLGLALLLFFSLILFFSFVLFLGLALFLGFVFFSVVFLFADFGDDYSCCFVLFFAAELSSYHFLTKSDVFFLKFVYFFNVFFAKITIASAFFHVFLNFLVLLLYFR